MPLLNTLTTSLRTQETSQSQMKMHRPKQTNSRNLSRIMQFFCRVKPKNDGSKTCTNIRILNHEDIDIIVSNLRFDLDTEDIDIGLQRIQHHDTVKVGYIYGMLDKINLQEWSDHLRKFLFRVLKFKPLISLQASRINDGSTFKVVDNTSFTPLFRQTQSKTVVHV